MKTIEIANLLDGIITGNPEKEITGINKIEFANEHEISFIANPLYEKYFDTTNAGAILVSENFVIKKPREEICVIRVQDPYLSFIKLLDFFMDNSSGNIFGISERSSVGKDVSLGEKVFIGDFTRIGDNCAIGKNTKIYSNCSIESNVKMGDNCIIYPNVVIYNDSVIGNNVIIHSGTVIGSDGFGFAEQEDKSYKKIQHIGNVVIEDDVEIGSNCTIDRASIGETRICRGVKLDNQIQVAHNVYIGEDTVITAQVGIAGSAKIGKRCKIAGKSGIVGHISICDDVTIGAMVGVTKSITKPGLYMGYRAKPYKEALKEEHYAKQIQNLENKIKELEKIINEYKNLK